jgi:DNA-binding transcriptional LysR family regulator
MTSPEQFEALGAGRIDLGVARLPSPSRAIASTRIVAEPFVVALPTGHGLARGAAVATHKLDGLPLVTFPLMGAVLRDAVLAELAEAGAGPRIVDEVIDMPTILGLVAAGRGIALVPASVATLGLKGVVFRPLRSPRRRAELWLVKRREDRRPVMSTLMELVMKAAS